MYKLVMTLAVLLGLVASSAVYAGGTEQDTRDGNKPAAESGGSGR